MKLKKNDITIRNAEKDDCNQLAAWWNDGNVMAHAGFPLGLNTTAEEIAEQIARDSDETKRRLIIEYQGKSIGEMSYYNKGNRVAEIGIKICDPAFQEKGLGRVILSLLIGELFSQGYAKIILDTDLENTRAQHVYEKLGFHKKQIRENSWKNQLGELRSSVDYELISDDFIYFAKKKSEILQRSFCRRLKEERLCTTTNTNTPTRTLTPMSMRRDTSMSTTIRTTMPMSMTTRMPMTTATCRRRSGRGRFWAT